MLRTVRLEATGNPLEQLMTGKDFDQSMDLGKVPLDRVVEFIVSMSDFQDVYIDLIDTYLEIQSFPCIHVRNQNVTFYVQDNDLLQLTVGPPADIVKQCTALHFCKLDEVSSGLFDNHASSLFLPR